VIDRELSPYKLHIPSKEWENKILNKSYEERVDYEKEYGIIAVTVLSDLKLVLRFQTQEDMTTWIMEN
jgi:hypothetical protein